MTEEFDEDMDHWKPEMLLDEAYCEKYNTRAAFFVRQNKRTSMKDLIVRYEDGRPEFVVSYPNEWSDERLISLLKVKVPGPYPVWERPSKLTGCPYLYLSPLIVGIGTLPQ